MRTLSVILEKCHFIRLMFFYCQMVSKLFVIDNLFCCWSNRHQARIIFMRSSLHLSEVIICMQACWYPMWGDWIQFWLLWCYVLPRSMMYSANHMLCCVMVSDGEGSIILLKPSQCCAPNCHVMQTKVFLYKSRHRFEKKNLCAVDRCGRLWLAWPVINTWKKNH